MKNYIKKIIVETPQGKNTFLKRFIENDQYRARLFRLKPKPNNTIQISIYKIKNKGLKAFEEIKDRQLPPISMTSPINSFEQHMVKAYNDCREQKLNKYLPVLTNAEVTYLLKDNYIQKKDIKRLLQ